MGRKNHNNATVSAMRMQMAQSDTKIPMKRPIEVQKPMQKSMQATPGQMSMKPMSAQVISQMASMQMQPQTGSQTANMPIQMQNMNAMPMTMQMMLQNSQHSVLPMPMTQVKPATNVQMRAQMGDTLFGNMFDIPAAWTASCKPAIPPKTMRSASKMNMQKAPTMKQTMNQDSMVPKQTAYDIYFVPNMFAEPVCWATCPPQAPKRMVPKMMPASSPTMVQGRPVKHGVNQPMAAAPQNMGASKSGSKSMATSAMMMKPSASTSTFSAGDMIANIFAEPSGWATCPSEAPHVMAMSKKAEPALPMKQNLKRK